MNLVKICDTVISATFYLLFFLVPLVFTSQTSELFEFNKMMLTYALAIIIGTAWVIKMIAAKKLIFRRSFLEIPLLLYLASHVLSTIFSIDPHVSIWGYYSRFHEGLLASLSYILLYFAAVSNLSWSQVKKIILVSFVSAAIVSIWGAMEHFGGSPSCLIFTGKFDDACWIQDVKNRVFATLGQPNWMAAYLDILILGALGFTTGKKRSDLLRVALATLFFAGLLFTKSRSGILGLGAGLAIFSTLSFWQAKRDQNLLRSLKAILDPARMTLIAAFIVVAFIFGLPFAQTEKLNLESLLTPKTLTAEKPAAPSGYIDIGISQSSDIRRIVWTGAIKVWERYPILGSGVETFAYAYYKDRPVEHNMVSEWDFLYNKAHNEFLNILATTGTVGVITYLILIGTFAFWILKSVIARSEMTKQSSLAQGKNDTLLVALFAGWTSILMTNFFGFSVVIIGLYFFLIPAFCWILKENPQDHFENTGPSSVQIGFIVLIGFIGLIGELGLLNLWNADKAYALGKNLDSAQKYVSANAYLTSAAEASPEEPTYHDELSYNDAVLAYLVYNQLQSSTASAIAKLSLSDKMNLTIPQLNLSANDLVTAAVAHSEKAVTISPRSLPFWKNRTKTFYQLSMIDSKFLNQTLLAIKKAAELAPTDAKVQYNLGLMLGKNGQVSEAIKALEATVAMKPDYRDAHYSLGEYYKQIGDMTKAREQMEFILKRIGPDNEAQKWLDENK